MINVWAKLKNDIKIYLGKFSIDNTQEHKRVYKQYSFFLQENKKNSFI